MTGLPRDAGPALAPVRSALADDAGIEARRITLAAGEEAGRILDRARRRAADTVRQAREEGAEAGRAEAALRSARARREAGAVVLAEQERLRSALREELLAQAAALRSDPRYPPLLQALRRRAEALLGPEAEISEASEGGLHARAGTRTLDLSLPALVRQELAADPVEVSRLWAA